jgi:NAD(P)H dehydrogenase (quinone)
VGFCIGVGGGMTKIVITGASGHFGNAATRLLLQHIPASDLILMSRKPEKLSEFSDLGCTTRYGDFDDPASLQKAFEGGDKLLLISGMQVGYRVKQHSNAIDAAAAAGIKHIVYTSYIGATQDNQALIAIDHYGTEEHLKASGVDWTAMRDGMYIDSMVEAAAPVALKTGVWISSGGDGKCSFVDRDDCVASAVAVLLGEGHENKVYNITAPELWSFREIAALIAEITSQPIEMQIVSDDALYSHFEGLGIPREALTEFNVDGYAWCCDDMVSYERSMREGHFAVVSNDIKMLTGKEPKSLREFVMERADFLRETAASA